MFTPRGVSILPALGQVEVMPEGWMQGEKILKLHLDEGRFETGLPCETSYRGGFGRVWGSRQGGEAPYLSSPLALMPWEVYPKADSFAH